MTEIIDLTGSDPADQDAVAMEVDTDRPQKAQTASAPPSLARTEDAGAAAPPAVNPKPNKDQAAAIQKEGTHEEKGEGQRKPPRYSQREKRPARAKTAALELAAGLPQHLPRISGRPTLQAMQAHLDTLQIGLRPRDPTVGSLPAELPPLTRPLPPGAQVIDMNASEWTQEHLNAEAAATVPGNLWAALLDDPPGVPADRLGRYTGQERQERRRAAAAPIGVQNGVANGGLSDGAVRGNGGRGGGGGGGGGG